MRSSLVSSKRCFVANAWTLHEGKVLLVRHHKLGIWLSPGGHIEENELPHQAAKREFEEETGVRCAVVSAYPSPFISQDSEYLPLPFYCNLHWINKPRKNGFCAQHYAFGYFVKVLDASGLHQEDEGVEEVRWFNKDELAILEMRENIRQEALYVFQHFPSR